MFIFPKKQLTLKKGTGKFLDLTYSWNFILKIPLLIIIFGAS